MDPKLARSFLILLGSALAASVAVGQFPDRARELIFAYGAVACWALYWTVGQKGNQGALASALSEAFRAAARGHRPERSADVPEAFDGTYRDLADIARRASERDEELKEAHKRHKSLEDTTSKLREELATVVEQQRSRLSEPVFEVEPIRKGLGEVEDVVDGIATNLESATGVAQDAARQVDDVVRSVGEVYSAIEQLASSAEESSSSLLEMTTTNEEVNEHITELASSVRETASSIEEMAYSIREVARNVDALSLTAEETSSSMNEMDVSIDQVQSNANETARLSEEVAIDAERGAEAILKTIGEIYRIKESSQEAVSVIANLGSRIEAIGQILAVIDDVAEQTNLLALNAAIIAAQAGEHGKGFAVVADEIKDLAERAGGSTKEIAELIKTIQAESRNAISAVERGAQNVGRGVEVSNEAERALKKILESSQKSTTMVRAIARATVEQAKGSKQVTDAIGRIAETVQQIAAATAQQARGSDLIMKSAEKMRMITQHVERSTQEQATGGKQITSAIQQITTMVSSLSANRKSALRIAEVNDSLHRLEAALESQAQKTHKLGEAAARLVRSIAK